MMKTVTAIAILSTLAASSSALLTGNPYAGAKMLAPNDYTVKVDGSTAKLVAAGDTATANAFKILRSIPTAYWADNIAALDKLPRYLEAAKKAAAAGPVVATFVVYDLPGRDCAAQASNGELAPTESDKYRTMYIDPYVKILKQYETVPNLRIVLIVEPDSLPNMATNLNVPKCATVNEVYRESVSYAIKNLATVQNVAMYLDAAWSGWIGYDDNRPKMAKIFADVLTRAGGSLAAGNQLIRGFATNVANYNPVVNEADANQPQYLKTKGEATYINALSQALVAEGVTGHTFITDTSRNGKNSIRDWASWCNIKNAGLGPRPTTATGSPLIDAFVWIKPPGDSDGVSDPAAPRFDGMCASKDSFLPSPQAGQWNHDHIVAMVKAANPPLTAADANQGTNPDDGSAPGTPTTGSPTTGNPTTGNPTTGTPTTGNPTIGNPTTGTPTTGNPTTGTPTTGTPASSTNPSAPANNGIPTIGNNNNGNQRSGVERSVGIASACAGLVMAAIGMLLQ